MAAEGRVTMSICQDPQNTLKKLTFTLDFYHGISLDAGLKPDQNKGESYHAKAQKEKGIETRL
jgi:hypothetical protein